MAVKRVSSTMSDSHEGRPLGDAPGIEAPLLPIVPADGTVIATFAEVAARLGASATTRVDVSGARGSAAAALVASISRSLGRPVVLVTSDLDAARKHAQDIAFMLGDATDEGVAEDTGASDVLIFSAHEASPYADVNPDRRAEMSRMATLCHLAANLPWKALVLPASALARKVVPRLALAEHTSRVVVGDELDRDSLIVKLSEVGYLRAPVVEDPGAFAVRGSLIDVWPPNREMPVRIELDGDMVMSIKSFDADDQRVVKSGDAESLSREVWLPPAREAILSADNVERARSCLREMADATDMPTTRVRALIDDVVTGRPFFGADGFLPAYFEELEALFPSIPPGAIVLLDDPPSIAMAVREALERASSDMAAKASQVHFELDRFFVDEDQICAWLTSRAVLALHRTAILAAESTGLGVFEVTRDPLEIAASDHEDLARAIKQARASRGKTAMLAPLVRRIAHWQEHGLLVFLAARAKTQSERLAMLLRHHGVKCIERDRFDAALLRDRAAIDATQLVVGSLTQGVVLPGEGYVLVTEEEVFGSRAHRKKERAAKDKSRPFLEDLRSLSIGDYVVHSEHGIGRYHGLVHKQVDAHVVDLLAVEYAGGDKLYLPIYRLNQIQKFSGAEGGAPKLDRLGGLTFAKTKSRAKKEVRKMADELLRLYAERQAQPGHAFPEVDDEYRAFEATFPYDETVDQANAIDAVNRDLGLDRPMDRLVCGDVGFGKTEVAIRAAFRAAMAGKQVCLLCPTTVLAQQHYRTFEARMRDSAIVVRAISRFQTTKEQNEVVALLKEGKVDIVIGTHRLLSKDIHFKDLGLLIVDEEQRFGVAHKERIKQIRANVDVLTLTATPIPRTLQMAVSGLRDLSLITTPPVDRRAVRTLVARYDETIVREAVRRELTRGGQVFYVYNRVEGLYEKARRLQELVPEARIAVAHGQMSRSEKEGESSVLEKTMLDFVEGRYDVLVATAIIESGLDIPRANTMVIDRADLFGLAQLYQLRGRVGRAKDRAYCYLIVPPADAMSDEARARIEALERHTELGSGFQIASLDLELRGGGDLLGGEQSGAVASVGFDLFCQMLDEAVHELRGEVVVHDVDPELSFDTSAVLPDEYINDVGIRLSLYKRLASAIDEAHVAELAEEMEERFGPAPQDARALVQLMEIKTELRRLKVLGCEATSRYVTLHLREDTPLDAAKIMNLVRKPKSPYRLTPDMRLTRRFDMQDEEQGGLANAQALLQELAQCMKPAA